MFIVITLLLVASIGGKVYMDKQEVKKEAEKIEAERMSVVALKKRYANIKSVEFKKSVYDEMTGSYIMFINMKNESGKSVSLRYTFWSNQEEVGSVNLEDKEIQVKGETTNKVKVVYSNKKEDEI